MDRLFEGLDDHPETRQLVAATLACFAVAIIVAAIIVVVVAVALVVAVAPVLVVLPVGVLLLRLSLDARSECDADQ